MSDALGMLSWYLVISLVGIGALPLAYRFFNRLPGRGLTLARPLGLLIWAYLFWLFNSLGILQNDPGGQIAAFAGLLLISYLTTRGGKFNEMRAWLKAARRDIWISEALFLVFFIGWALVRGMNPEAAYTEKPMELAFINSILRSPTFPPQDPWLSGYAISYYYFGYVMIAMLTRITGVAASVGFNLTSALWFAMTAAALYGVVYDITALFGKREGVKDGFSRKAGLLGPLYVLIISTVEGVLEFLHAGGIFWKSNGNGALTSKFWTWLGILDLNVPPQVPFDWIPSRPSGWLWWRGSRVIQDLTLSGANVEVIDEFPFFSYLLSDLHPHLLAVPFALLAVATGLNLLAGAKLYVSEKGKITGWAKNWTFWLTALMLGSLGFINTWDFPIYVGLFCLVWAYMRYQAEGWKISLLWDFLKNGLVLGFTGFLLYLPFYLGFDSQAGGLLPSLEFMTRGIHFWVLFAALLVPLLAFCVYSFRKTSDRKNFLQSLKIVLIILVIFFMISILYGGLLLSLGQIGTQLATSANASMAALGVKLTQGGNAFTGVHGNYPAGDVLVQALLRRINAPGTWLTLGVLLVLILAVLSKRNPSTKTSEETLSSNPGRAGDNPASEKTAYAVESFILILALVGVLLTIFPEYLYLRDQFGTRMNTIFKFYYQAWILWGIAAAAGSAILFKKLHGWRMVAFQVSWVVVLFAGLVYPSLMLWNKTNRFNMQEWTLDGNAYFQRYYPGDHAAILWLQQAPLGVITEAVGGSYTDYARVSTRSGQPTVLGWPGHESQWRGGGEEMGSRYSDIQLLYETVDWGEASRLLARYNVKYVYVGNLERSSYKVNEDKFKLMLTIVYGNEDVTIYEVPETVGALP